MPFSVTMPRLGESVTEGTVTRWLKKEGDHVAVDEPLLEVSTDKVDTEIPSPVAGILRKITVAEDETVDVGSELAVIDDAAAAGGGGDVSAVTGAAEVGQAAPTESAPPAESLVAPPASAPTAPPVPTPAPAPTPAPEPAAPAPAPAPAPPSVTAASIEPTAAAAGDTADTGDASYVTPLVRKLAAERNVDLTGLAGSGVGGRIRKHDVIAAAEAAKTAVAPNSAGSTTAGPVPAPTTTALRGRTEKMSRLRTVLASRMVESLQTAAQCTTVIEVDVSRIARLREAGRADFEAREGAKLSFLPFFAVATVEALKQHPVLNASIDVDAGTITYHDAEHLGIAVDTERGLLVPVIHGAGDLNLGGVARKIADLAHRTRTNQVNPDELSGGTFTITNTGSRGALFDTPILLPPQVGILSTGVVVKRPVVIEDAPLGETIAIRSMVFLALTYDQRLVDGADAARFLATLKTRLEEGRFEAELSS
jgi:pyruvate dehydrogenase E2 component (dihydrolipoamide acetyltransferase)